jgi:DNA modification methylase
MWHNASLQLTGDPAAMISDHRIHFADARQMTAVASESVHLVVTSPPYPMIEMWDDLFCRHTDTADALRRQDGMAAFESMHRQLDPVWAELHRVLVPGGMACINIGDATRTVNGEFALYPNHSRILSHMLALGFTNLPNILWRKQTNAPNKFMGSGMMPPGAYVTLEHETILVCRKGAKRLFGGAAEKANRRRSAFFWEERNVWFSDVWMDLKGTRQQTGGKALRQRSGAYPFELAYRLIAMFSVMGDTVLDPFLGTGTSLFAAAAAGRNGLGYELDKAFASSIAQDFKAALEQGRQRAAERFDRHLQFVDAREAAGKPIRHTHRVYGFPVVTRQEAELAIPMPQTVEPISPDHYRVTYDQANVLAKQQPAAGDRVAPMRSGQLKLFE